MKKNVSLRSLKSVLCVCLVGCRPGLVLEVPPEMPEPETLLIAAGGNMVNEFG